MNLLHWPPDLAVVFASGVVLGLLIGLALNGLRRSKPRSNAAAASRRPEANGQPVPKQQYLPIRRLEQYIESSIYEGTQWAVFEANGETLWGELRLNIGEFMQGLFTNGLLAGTTPQEAYFVKCDSDNNPPASIALGVVNIDVGFAPLYPAEFVVIQIQQKAVAPA